MRQVETTIDIHATPQQVWSVLTDFPAFKQWNPFMVNVELSQGKQTTVYYSEAGLLPSAEGKPLTVTIQPEGKKPTTFTSTLTQVKPGQELQWLGTLGSTWIFGGTHYFKLSAKDANTTTLVHGEEFTGALTYVLGSMIDGAHNGFNRMNNALKQRVEQKYQQVAST